MLQDLQKEQERFNPYLLEDHYTFIGPADPELWDNFLRNVNNFAPVVSIFRSIHHALSHQESVEKAISLLPENASLRIFVVIPKMEDILLHSTITEYCTRYNINYPPKDQ